MSSMAVIAITIVVVLALVVLGLLLTAVFRGHLSQRLPTRLDRSDERTDEQTVEGPPAERGGWNRREGPEAR